MLHVTIYHNDESRFLPYQDGHRLVAVTSHPLPADDAAAADTALVAADWAFHTFNVDLDALEADRHTLAGEVAFLAGCVHRLLGRRSLSVGDIVHVTTDRHDHWLACEPAGWQRINPPANRSGDPLSAATIYRHLAEQRTHR